MLKYATYILSIVFCLCSSKAEAETVDSIAYSVMTNSLRREIYEKTINVPMGLSLLPKQAFSHTALTYQHETGELKRIQKPERLNDVSLTSIGLYSAKRWQVYGKFAYHRTFSDSIQWLLSEEPRNGMPYYFASPRKGNWETETYNLNGNFNIDIFPSFKVGASASIRYFKGTRSNDPRPSAESFLSHYYLYAGWRLSSITLTVEGGLGYGTSDNNIVYKNTDNDRPMQLDMMAYEFMGFGINRKTQKFQNRELESNIYTRHLGIQLESKLNNLIAWGRFEYDRQQDSIRRSRTQNVDRSLLSTYTTDAYSLTLGIVWSPSDKIRLETIAFTNSAQGYDKLKNILQGQKNYVYHHTDFGLKTWMTVKQNNLRTDFFGWSLNHSSEKRMDGSSEHSFRKKMMVTSIMWGQKRTVMQSYRLSYHFRQGLEIPRSTLTYPESQKNIFTTDIAIPLKHYYDTNRGYTNINAVIGKKIGHYMLCLSLDYRLLYMLKSSTYPKGVRNTLSSSLILSF